MCFLKIGSLSLMLVLLQCSNGLRFENPRPSLDFKKQNVFKDLFMQQSSLGVAVTGNFENRALMSLNIPISLYSYDRLVNNCSDLGSELDGYIFFTSYVSAIKTDIIQSLACFNKTTLKLNTKKVVILIETNLIQDDSVFLTYFSWLWKNFGIINLIFLVAHNKTEKIEFLTFNPFLKIKSNKGQLLRYNVSTEATDSFEQVLKNLQGHTLKAFLFPFAFGAHPAFLNDSKTIQGGPDLTFMITLQQIFNVHFEHHRPGDYMDFIRNGTANGALRDLSNNCVDILINSKTMKSYETDRIQFVFPRKYSNFVVLVKKQGIISGWRIALHLLQGQVWLCLILAFIACSAVYVIIGRIHFGPPISFEGGFVIMKSFLSVSIIRMPQTHPERILITVCLMLSVVIINLFFGQVFYLMKSEPRLPNINSLEELQNSNLPIVTVYSNFLHAFDGLKNTPLGKLPERLKYQKLDGSTFGVYSKHLSDKYAVLTSDGFLEMQAFLQGPGYFENIHVLKEHVMSFTIAQLMPVGSIYFNQFNTLAIKLFDHGFFNKWLYEYLSYIKEENTSTRQQNQTNELDETDALDLEDLKFPFFIILVGFVSSFIVFLAEILLKTTNFQPC